MSTIYPLPPPQHLPVISGVPPTEAYYGQPCAVEVKITLNLPPPGTTVPLPYAVYVYHFETTGNPSTPTLAQPGVHYTASPPSPLIFGSNGLSQVTITPADIPGQFLLLVVRDSTYYTQNACLTLRIRA